MCVEYQFGKLKGPHPVILEPDVVAALRAIMDVRHVWPKYSAPVILPDGSMREMSWGFRWQAAPKKKGGKPSQKTTVNSRENHLGKHMWRTAFANRRCLVPVSWFYENGEVDGRKAHLRFEQANGDTLWVAGIWERHQEHGECFSLITTEPSDFIRPFHDRMLALLSHDQIPPYLNYEIHEFGPSDVPLVFEVDRLGGPAQGELF